jgi:hypothetical protein
MNTTCLIYRLYNRKNPKERHPKMITDPRRSLATNIVNQCNIPTIIPSLINA